MRPDHETARTRGPASSRTNGSRTNGAPSNGPEPVDPPYRDPEVTDLLGVLYRRRWWVGAAILVAALAGYGLGWRSPVENRADTRLLLVERSDEGVVTPATDPLPLEERQSAVVSRAESQRTRAGATEALGLAPGDLKSISAEAAEGESFVTIGVTTAGGVDAAAAADEVAASVVAQQRAAVSGRSDALAAELRASAAEIDAEIEEVDTQLAQLAREIALLQLNVDQAAGTGATVDPQVSLTLKNDEAAGLRSTRRALLTTQSDFERQAKEADVAAAVSSGGLEVYEPAGTPRTAHTVPPVQLAVLLASLALVVTVCAAYFTAYRTEPRGPVPFPPADHRGDGHATAPRERPEDAEEREDDDDEPVHAERP